MLDFIKNIAYEAGKILKGGYEAELKSVQHKGEVDLVTEIDLAIEKYLTDEISRKYSSHFILAEENASFDECLKNDSLWIIDPLDGTTNFTHKYPFCVISIAYKKNHELYYGVVYNPLTNEMFFAEKNKGAFLNGKPIKISKEQRLSHSLVATGFPYDRWKHGDDYVKEFLAFMKKTQGVRRDGAAALDLCYVACGRFDGFFERKLKEWDVAAGKLIVEEAGGQVTQYNGHEWNWVSNNILVSNGLIHDDMIKVLGSIPSLDKEYV